MGPRHLFTYIKLVREYISTNLQKNVFSSIGRNGYFAHPENVLLTMFFDSDEYLKKKV